MGIKKSKHFHRVTYQPDLWISIARVAILLGLVYVFLVSISLLGAGLKLLAGADFVRGLITSTKSPAVGLFIGILVTSVVQSSSTTTSITVGLVGSGMMSLDAAIPIVMGANVGTSVTNILVSLGHIRVKPELQRAFGAAVVHDIFNLMTVLVFFPLQLQFNILGKSANYLSSIFEQAGGMHFTSPLKLVVKPTVCLLEAGAGHNGWIVIVLALALLFISLHFIVRVMKSLVLKKLSIFFDRVIFRSPLVGLFFGMLVTAIIQSSSVTTSLIVPLAGAGLITLEQVFPYTLGANVGTTVTALMASLVTETHTAVTVAFAHLLFNLFGIAVFLPLKGIPIFFARKMALLSTKSRFIPVGFVLLFFIIIPLLLIKIMG